MNKLLLVFVWLFTIAISYWYGLSQKMESDRLFANRSEVTDSSNSTTKPDTLVVGTLSNMGKASVSNEGPVQESNIVPNQEVET